MKDNENMADFILYMRFLAVCIFLKALGVTYVSVDLDKLIEIWDN